MSLFADALPGLRSSPRGAIDEPALPHLRHLVVVDNTSGPQEFQMQMDNVRSATDFRELFIWDEHAKEQMEVEQMEKTLHHDEVINLQFTRCA